MIYSLNTASELIKSYLQANIVPFFLGSPGIGKSSVVHSIAEQAKLILIDIRLAEKEPTDVSGYPTVENGRSYVAPPQTMPIEGDEVPEGYNGWLIFLDELTNAPPAVQNVAYKLLLDRMVGDHKLHPQVYLVASGNKATDGCHTEELSAAMISRTAFFEVTVDSKEWAEFASSVQADPRIIALINWQPKFLYTFNPDAIDPVYACPRTWMAVNKLIKERTLSSKDVGLLSPLIGEGVAREFIAFAQIYQGLPNISTIVQNPTEVNVPDQLDLRWATLTSIASKATHENIEPLLKYVNRFPGELRIVCMRQLIKRDPSFLDLKVIDKWFDENAAELL